VRSATGGRRRSRRSTSTSGEHPDVRTVVVDPVSNVVDQLADVAPEPRGTGPDYQWVNKKLLGFVKSLRTFDVNVVLVGHEKLNDGKGGDGKLYPALGGPTLINKLLAEMDIVAHVERVPKPTEDDPGAAVWIGQIQPRDNLVTKDGTDALGDRRIADLSRWFEVASEALAPSMRRELAEGYGQVPEPVYSEPIGGVR
jgi:hypothetical protein